MMGMVLLDDTELIKCLRRVNLHVFLEPRTHQRQATYGEDKPCFVDRTRVGNVRSPDAKVGTLEVGG
jgi:hypothetical protein